MAPTESTPLSHVEVFQLKYSTAVRQHLARLARGHAAVLRLRDVPLCTYCGAVATTIDHVPPVSQRARLRELDPDGDYRNREVPACRECNIALGARPLWTLTDRRRYIAAWLATRYAALLDMPAWSQADLDQLSGRLRQHVEYSLQARAFIRARLSYAHGRS